MRSATFECTRNAKAARVNAQPVTIDKALETPEVVSQRNIGLNASSAAMT